MRSFIEYAAYLAVWAVSFDLNWVELALYAAIGLLAVFGVRFGALPGHWRRRGMVAGAGVAALAGRLALLPILPIPEPQITDEFSHRLLADTLAQGRLANPVHPMWRYFETIHVIQKPTYASMYLPAQGAVLALGKVLSGHPWWGVWLSNGVLCAALCWALLNWFPTRWAAFGAALAICRFALFSYWNDSYWGGTVPAIGGALIVGAVGAMRRGRRAGSAFGVGASILLLSRPFEGLALCLAAVTICRRSLLSREGMRAAAILAASGLTLSFYCYRVTGSPVKLPYQVNQEVYGWPMTLLFTQPRESHTTVKELRDYYDWEVSQHSKAAADSIIEKGQFLWGFFVGPALSVPLLFARRLGPLAWMSGAVIAAVLLEQTGYPHYFSPGTAAFLAVIVQGARRLYQTRAGRVFVPALPWVLAGALLFRVVAATGGVNFRTLAGSLSWCCNVQPERAREDLRLKLEATPGKHLVIVHYGPEHRFDREWVYNAADIDAAKIVWARDLDGRNEDLKAYFQGRRVWDVQVEK